MKHTKPKINNLSSLFNITHPRVSNVAFRKMPIMQNWLRDMIVREMKEKLLYGYEQDMRNNLRELPMNKKMRSAIKGNITRLFNYYRKRVAKYEEEFGEVTVSDSRIANHFESGIIK